MFKVHRKQKRGGWLMGRLCREPGPQAERAAWTKAGRDERA